MVSRLAEWRRSNVLLNAALQEEVDLNVTIESTKTKTDESLVDNSFTVVGQDSDILSHTF